MKVRLSYSDLHKGYFEVMKMMGVFEARKRMSTYRRVLEVG